MIVRRSWKRSIDRRQSLRVELNSRAQESLLRVRSINSPIDAALRAAAARTRLDVMQFIAGGQEGCSRMRSYALSMVLACPFSAFRLSESDASSRLRSRSSVSSLASVCCCAL